MARCQILADEENGRPVFTVTVNNVTHTAPVGASDLAGSEAKRDKE